MRGSVLTLLCIAECFLVLSAPYDSWNITSKQTASCKEGEYVQGLVYTTDYPENTSFSYFLTSVGFICSSSTLGERTNTRVTLGVGAPMLLRPVLMSPPRLQTDLPKTLNVRPPDEKPPRERHPRWVGG